MDRNTYRRKRRLLAAFCLVLAAAVLRLIAGPQLWQRAGSRLQTVLAGRDLFAAVLYLETGMVLQEPAGQAVSLAAQGTKPAQPPAATAAPAAPETAPAATAAPPAPETEPPSAETTAETSSEAAEPLPEPFSPEEADRISLRGNCTYKVDKRELLDRALDWEMKEGPKVLIIHSHSCESYTQCEGHTYIPDANFRTLEKEESVIAVGDELERELNRLGVETVHDRSWNDYPSYNSSYAVARKKIAEWLAEYPSIVMVLDLHRDALEDPVRETAALGGVTCAPLMLVVGTDEGGLDHPHWERNLSAALKLQALANREEPDLFKSLSFRKERFNGDMTPGSLIVEVGSTENTLPEAQASMPYLARYVAELLRLAEAEAD
jgi:stage II sporulation protein P